MTAPRLPSVPEVPLELGAQACTPIYNGLDPSEHRPPEQPVEHTWDLLFMGNRLPDREARVEEFFLRPAEKLRDKRFLLGGSGWADKALPSNIKYLGHVYTNEHNAFNCTPMAVLNISRDSMARYGFSPATRVFEAAGAAACIITDHWKGIETFFEPGKEILVVKNGEEVEKLMSELTPERAREIGRGAYHRVRSEHTYVHRAELLQQLIEEAFRKENKPVENLEP